MIVRGGEAFIGGCVPVMGRYDIRHTTCAHALRCSRRLTAPGAAPRRRTDSVHVMAVHDPGIGTLDKRAHERRRPNAVPTGT